MGPVVVKLLKETGLMLLRKITWQLLVERFMTRLVIYGLESLEAKATNTVTKQTVRDVLACLQGKQLDVIEQKCLTDKGGNV